MRSKILPVLAFTLLVGCERGQEPEDEDTWEVVAQEQPGALLSVWGTSARDVWVVGAGTNDGNGPTVLHLQDDAWQRVPTGQSGGDLWWVFGFSGGPVYMGGDGGVILRYQDGGFTTMQTPGTETVYGIWGASPDDVWAVGGASESSGGFAWRLRGDVWEPEPSVPSDVATDSAIWKIFGTSADDAWAVGSNGVALHWDGSAFSPGQTGVGSSLFTVHAQDGVYAAVGGFGSGFIMEYSDGQWADVTPEPPPMGLSGVTLGEAGTGVVVGLLGTVYVRDEAGWRLEELDLPVRQNLHGSWIDDEGGLWVAGGNTLSVPFTDGVLIHRGRPAPTGGL